MLWATTVDGFLVNLSRFHSISIHKTQSKYTVVATAIGAKSGSNMEVLSAHDTIDEAQAKMTEIARTILRYGIVIN
jgi:hypothetical protein